MILPVRGAISSASVYSFTAYIKALRLSKAHLKG